MALDTSRVLRIGVVFRGQVLAERVLDRRIDVTVGTRADSTIAVDAKQYPDFPAQIVVAAVQNGAYHVVLPADPKHTVMLRGGPAGSQSVPKDGVIQVRGQKAVPIEPYTGGSMTLGEITLMFQFVRGDTVPTVTREETVLRIGLVHEDRLLSDQVFRPGELVTIGTDAKATIALPDNEYKGQPAIFKPLAGGKFLVTLPKDCNLRLAIDGTPMDANEAIQKKLVRLDGNQVIFELPTKSRGRASLGPYTLLFQVVKQTITVPTMPRKSLLVQLAGPLIADSTWTIAFLAAFLLIGSIVGQAILFQRTTGKFLGKAQMEETMASTTYEVLIEEKEEVKKEEDKPEAPELLSEAAKKEQKKEIEKEDKKKPAPKAEVAKPVSTGKQIDPEELKRNARENLKKTSIAGALMGPGGAATKLFGAAGEGEDGTVVAKTFGGAGAGEGEGDGPGEGGVKLAGGTGASGGTMEKVGGKNTGFGKRESDATKVDVAKTEEKKVVIKLDTGALGGDGEGKGDVAKVVSRKNSAVQRCYEQALRENPDVGGKVKVTFTVGTAGTVTEVNVSGATGAFAECIKSKFMGIRGLPILGAPQSFTQSYIFSQS